MKRLIKPLTFVLLAVIILTSCHFPGTPWVLVEITSHEEGQSVVQYEETRIITEARSSQGIDKVELYINGELEHIDEPPMGFPRDFTADQPWMPVAEGEVIISVIAIDRRGTASEPVSITLKVVETEDDIDTDLRQPQLYHQKILRLPKLLKQAAPIVPHSSNMLPYHSMPRSGQIQTLPKFGVSTITAPVIGQAIASPIPAGTS